MEQMVTTLLLFLSSVLSGVFFFIPLFFFQYFSSYYFIFDLDCSLLHKPTIPAPRWSRPPPTARGQFSKGLQLINMLLPRPRRQWDRARRLPTFIFSYDLYSRRVTSCAAVTVLRSGKRWCLLVPHTSPWMLHAKQTESCSAHRKRTTEHSFNTRSALSLLKEVK